VQNEAGGTDLREGAYVFEVYLGFSDKISKKLVYAVDEYDFSHIFDLELIPKESIDVDFSLRQLNLIILADNTTNMRGL
jgi:hypothetical protein